MPIGPRARFALWSAATAVFWCGMAVMTHVPPAELPRDPLMQRFAHADKVIHSAAYAVLAGLLTTAVLSFRQARRGTAARLSAGAAVAIFAVVAAYGAIDELTQPLTGRKCEAIDFAVDLLGAGVGVAAARWRANRGGARNRTTE